MQVVGDFTLLEPLGTGELGEQYLGVKPAEPNSSCVIEILDPDLARDVERVEATLFEVAAARRFFHPSAERVLGAGRHRAKDGSVVVWVARPHAIGWSLRELLDHAEAVSEQLLVQVSVWVVARTAEIVEAGHRSGLLHGALAPESVRITEDAEVRLADLGLGSLLGASERRLAFRAPELLTENLLTPRADVYGLGMLLSACLLGEAPFARHDPLSTRRAILEHRLPRARATRPALSPRMDDIVARLCALDPGVRPGTAAEVVERLDEVLGPSADLVPTVLARQLERVPPPRALDPAALDRAERRVAADTLPEASSEPRRPVSRRQVASGRGRVAGARPRLPETPRIGRFSLERHEESDGPIEVWEALDLEAATLTRLRVLDLGRSEPHRGLPADVWVTAFEQEIALAGSLAHPCVARFRATGEDDGHRWLAYAPPPSETLAARLGSGRRPAPTAVLLDLARVLEHLHERGVLACGLSTRSVRISSRGLAVFADLGRISPIDGWLHPLLEDEPFAMTPELAGARRHDQRSDLFVLGTVAYELLTGTRPFRGLDTWSVLEALRTRVPRAPSDLDRAVDPELSALTMQLLERNPANRPASASFLVELLENRNRRRRFAR